MLCAISIIAMAKIGTVNTTAIFIFLTKSLYVFWSSVSLGFIGIKSIPHIGHEPGLSWITSGCIGQVYNNLLAASSGALTKSIPHTGQSPAFSYTLSPSQCIGQ